MSGTAEQALIDAQVFENEHDRVVREEIETFRRKARAFLDGEITEDEFRPFRLKHGIYGQRQPGVQMVRSKIPGGMMTAAQAGQLARVAEEFGGGRGHLTTRQNIQFHFVPLDRTADLMHVLALESVRQKVMVVGEDLGTVTSETRHGLDRFGLYGYRVPFFEKIDGGEFRPPGQYTPHALVSSSTHDLPTLAGYWIGRDIEARRAAGRRGSGAGVSQKVPHAGDRVVPIGRLLWASHPRRSTAAALEHGPRTRQSGHPGLDSLPVLPCLRRELEGRVRVDGHPGARAMPRDEVGQDRPPALVPDALLRCTELHPVHLGQGRG